MCGDLGLLCYLLIELDSEIFSHGNFTLELLNFSDSPVERSFLSLFSFAALTNRTVRVGCCPATASVSICCRRGRGLRAARKKLGDFHFVRFFKRLWGKACLLLSWFGLDTAFNTRSLVYADVVFILFCAYPKVVVSIRDSIEKEDKFE